MTKKIPLNENATPGGGFDYAAFKEQLTKQYGKLNAEFFSMAFREQAGAFLEQSSRFAKLAEWCEKEIRLAGQIINTFSPASKTNDYKQTYAEMWREQVKTAAELIYFHGLLLDSRTTMQERENIEYAICKFYNVQYSKDFEDYI